MTITERRQPRPDTDHADDGGVPARRAVARWAWRLFRREWRGQALVLGLLTLAVAAAVGGSAAAYNLAPAAGDARFGSATHSVEFDEPDPQALQIDVPAAREWFDEVDVIGRRFVPVPGLFDEVELRAQDPRGPYSAPILALVDGRYPTNAGEVALTDGVAQTYGVGIGDTLDLDGVPRAVVGTVESPSDLHDEFALVSVSDAGPPDSITMLVGGSDEEAEAFRPPSGAAAAGASRPGNEGGLAAGAALAAGAIILMLVALVAAAGFIVIAQRRLRQLGMLAAVGATEQHLRLVMVANGAVIGAIAAVAGSTLGLVAWVAVAPALEPVLGHRVATFDVPWWVIGTAMLLAVVTATGAAWWPARSVARIPVVSALSGRPPTPRRTNRYAGLAVGLVVLGTGSLVLAGDPLESWFNSALILVGTVVLIFGILFVSPLAIRALGSLRMRTSVAVRLALGDLSRYQARSATALAAISLALGIATIVVVTASSAMYGAATEGNLSDRQLVIRIGEIPGQGDVAPVGERTPAEVDQLDATVDQIADSLDASVNVVDVAVAPEFEGFGGLGTVVLGVPVEVDDGTAHRIVTPLYVATPGMLGLYGLDQGAVDPDTEVLTVETGELWFQPVETELVRNPQQLPSGYTSVPGSFITPAALARRGWEAARAGWLVEAGAPVTDNQFAEVREVAAAAGVTVEIRHDQANLATLRTGATGVGILVALGVMAMTVGLIRSEAGRDLPILTAAGATSNNRRTLTAATAGSLALLGALIGTLGAYLGLAAAHVRDLDALTPVPWVHLAVLVVGLPVVAAGAGWVLAGREPGWLARPME